MDNIRIYLFITILFFLSNVKGQDIPHLSIHNIENEKYKNLGLTTIAEFDSLNRFGGKIDGGRQRKYSLSKRVFGYFPYWAGSNYVNYQWDLLSDLCYFSYEVDPSTGNPLTIHDWYSSPAIDMAMENGVDVHLCVTLFSGHSAFFNSSTAPQNLIDNIIVMIQNRDATGVNIDFEAMPSAYGDDFTDFMISLSTQIHNAIPGSEVSIAAPAVNWNDKFNIPVLKDNIDFFMVMGYDYYWNGSSTAGPVSPLYSMISSTGYTFSRTISYYESEGVPVGQIIMGIPYYGRQWPTASQFAPSPTTGSGTAYTYRYIRDNSSGHYSNENKYWESNSFSPYFSFYSNGWHQCFVEDTYSLGKKYDIVNRRGLAGIGIWALGYDDGYTDFWDLLAGRFTAGSEIILSDTVFDSGGPAFNYFNNEIYYYTIPAPEGKQVELSFEYVAVETGYDTLWVFNGEPSNLQLIDFFTGSSAPGTIKSQTNHLTLKFYSDGATTGSGWKAVYNIVSPSSVTVSSLQDDCIEVTPNPFIEKLTVKTQREGMLFVLFNTAGEKITGRVLTGEVCDITLPGLEPGTYIYTVSAEGNICKSGILIKK